MSERPTRAPLRWRGAAHATPYWRGEGVEGVRAAARKGKGAIDLDLGCTADGVWINTHWNRALLHGYKDPAGRTKRTAKLSDLPWELVETFVAPDGRMIQRIEVVLREANRLGMRVELEPKGQRGLRAGYKWDLLAKYCARIGLYRIQVKMISTMGRPDKTLAAAHAAGFTTMILPRGSRRVPRSWWGFIDHVRGPVIWTGRR